MAIILSSSLNYKRLIDERIKVIDHIDACHVPLHEECPKHHGHKGDMGMTPGTCDAIGEKAQAILLWVRFPGVKNASHPRR
jgi:hypothetical protein